MIREPYVKGLSRHILTGKAAPVPVFHDPPDNGSAPKLSREVIHKVVFLCLDETPKRLAPPRVAHRRDIAFLRRGLLIFGIQFTGLISMYRNWLKGIGCFVIHAAVEVAVKSLDHHDLGAFSVVFLQTVLIDHAIMLILKLYAVPAVHLTLGKNGKDQVDFFIFGLFYEHRFDTINEW